MEQNIRIKIGDTLHSVVRDSGILSLGYRWMEWASKDYCQDPIVAAIEHMDEHAVASVIDQIDSLTFGIAGNLA